VCKGHEKQNGDDGAHRNTTIRGASMAGTRTRPLGPTNTPAEEAYLRQVN
jgi:hypothetical protein